MRHKGPAYQTPKFILDTAVLICCISITVHKKVGPRRAHFCKVGAERADPAILPQRIRKNRKFVCSLLLDNDPTENPREAHATLTARGASDCDDRETELSTPTRFAALGQVVSSTRGVQQHGELLREREFYMQLAVLPRLEQRTSTHSLFRSPCVFGLPLVSKLSLQSI